MEKDQKRIEVIEEAIRVLKVNDEKTHLFRNQEGLLRFELNDEEDAPAIEYWGELFDDINSSLEDARSNRETLINSMEEYIQEMKQPSQNESYHPLLGRSGKR